VTSFLWLSWCLRVLVVHSFFFAVNGYEKLPAYALKTSPMAIPNCCSRCGEHPHGRFFTVFYLDLSLMLCLRI